MTPDDRRPGDEDLLIDLLESGPNDPRRAELVRERPELARELEALERTAGELDRRSRDGVEAEIEAALQNVDEDLERRLEAFAHGSLAPAGERAAVDREVGPEPIVVDPPPRAPLRLLPGWIALAAAAALLMLLTDFGGDRQGSGEAPVDGGERGDLLLNDRPAAGEAWPSGAVSDWGAFQWTGAPSTGSFQQVRIWAADRPFGAPLFESPELVSPSWSPDPTTLEALPTKLVWRVFEIDAVTGEELELHELNATLAD